jgi:hypothetical protein
MYFVANIEMQICYIKFRMKMTLSKCIGLEYTYPELLSCSSSLALKICHFCMNFFILSLYLNPCNKLHV